MRLVLKFGGSSLATIEKIKKIAEYIKIIKQRENLELVIVVSAMGKTTNKLDSLANSICYKPMSSAYSSLLSVGENISVYLLTLALENININAIGLTSKDVKIYAQGSYTNGIITHIDSSIIENYLSQNKVVVISGFQGENTQNQTITLGRGGSDTTAVALGNVLNATVKIFTDVNGFYALNPSEFNFAKKLKKINIHSAIELSSVNAKVLDYRCLSLANQNKTNLTVGKSLSNEFSTITYIDFEKPHIDGISTKPNITFVNNTNKKSVFLQTIIQNCNAKNFFYQKNSTEILVSTMKKTVLKTIANVNKQKLIIKNADLCLLTGSGLVLHKNFLKKVQKIISENKIASYFINLTQTTLIIITKQNQGKKLEKILATKFNLIKEQLYETFWQLHRTRDPF